MYMYTQLRKTTCTLYVSYEPYFRKVNQSSLQCRHEGLACVFFSIDLFHYWYLPNDCTISYIILKERNQQA